MPFTIKLSAPLATHGGLITEVVFRDPTARDLLVFGEPTIVERQVTGRFDGTMTMRVIRNMAVVGKYLEALSGLDSGAIGAIPARQVKAAIDWICDDMLSEDAGPLSPAPSAL